LNTFAYFVIVDLIILIVVCKIIFGSFSIFSKAILGHIFSDFNDAEIFKKWEQEHDISHKINILYWFILAIFGISLLVYTFLIRK
jgi:ABC-type Fe3+-siderophore transport system permease subunit